MSGYGLDYFLLNPTRRQRWAHRYLSAHGQRFLVHYGYENAYEKAREMWLASGRKRWRLN
jgi:hypothetical protein